MNSIEDLDLPLGSATCAKDEPDLMEALAVANSLTPMKAKWRIAAKNRLLQPGGVTKQELLNYILRMGSFHSAPKIQNKDSQDDEFELSQDISRSELLEFLLQKQKVDFPLFKRNISIRSDLFDDSNSEIKVLQWNILAQTLGTAVDNFEKCPRDALDWDHRKFYIISEIIEQSPDIICLQEVDHFSFLKNVLHTQGYDGVFYPKPDSPCIYTEGNNGPDGCALFFNTNRFKLVTYKCKILEVWKVPSNQVVIVAVLEDLVKNIEICVATTHLKARKGNLLSKLRNEQGKDMLDFIFSVGGQRPLILSGDFNAEPTEPIYETVLTNKKLELASAYSSFLRAEKTLENADMDPHTSIANELPYTTWKVRGEGEICHTIDYIFMNKKVFSVAGILDMPTDGDLGADRVPSYRYPSDHFSLMCTLTYN